MQNKSTDHALDLVVHSITSPNSAATNTIAAPLDAKGGWKLLAIMFVCSLPVAISYMAYFVAQRPANADFGEFVRPALAMPNQSLLDLAEKPKPLAALKGQWLIVSVDGGACPQTCQAKLFLHRQLRETLGKGKERVDWVWLIDDQAPVAPSMHKPLQDAHVLRVDAVTLQAWFPAPPAGQSATQFLYLVDPLGNTIMRFPAQFDIAGAAKLRRVIERLLRGTASWDEPGRQ